MESEGRKITKIAREVSKFTVQTMKEDGIGTAEFDFIHLVRHCPGITQAEVREELKIDKGAAARRTARLEEKGYLVRKLNEEDRRSARLFATEKAEGLKNSKVEIETVCYDWMLAQLTEEERKQFLRMLEKLYQISKNESRGGFSNIKKDIRMKRVENKGE